MDKEWSKIQTSPAILISHSPPFGHCDLSKKGVECGDKKLLNQLETRVRPILHLFGHIHEAHGYDCWEEITLYVNAALSQRIKKDPK